ncbi:MAG: family 78 glycoside hydrolase catalytic domain [Parabacteroides sp.]|nr:family 78 glycoside hydrolase catalytic domain [Parabacteroides sp.]
MKYYCLLLSFLLGFVASVSGQGRISVCNLRCEYIEDPIAVENEMPLLSWQLRSAGQAKSQTAYRILVASSPSLLADKQADFWDSGKVTSFSSNQIEYKGKCLESRQTLYWKVMVWDEKGKPSSWSDTGKWTMGLLKLSDWKARWIGNREDLYPDSTLTYPAPYFRKGLRIGKPVRQAKVYICGLGFYEMYLNGTKVGDQVLAPAVTNFDRRPLKNMLYFFDDQSTKRVLYNTFDVTSLLQKEGNTVGVLLGNGWYNQRDRTVEGCMWYDTPRLLCQLEIEYVDGSTEMVCLDDSWKTTTGPLLHDGIFTGEAYDARLELDGWNRNGYDDSSWEKALVVRAPSGDLHAQLAPYDRVVRTLQPVRCEQKNDSIYWFVFPEMVSGWAQINVEGNAGDQIKLRFVGEENDDFGQVDLYTLRGNRREQWEPRFTWHTFRYIEVLSPQVKINESSLIAKVAHTDPESAGSFDCSNELFNKINEVYLRTQKNNFHGSISSDCPHRERLAYTGDAQVVVESSILSFDMTQFYRKWFMDMEDARNRKSGYVPHTAPFGGGGGGPAWGSAYVIMPWAYYCYYGDTTLLRQHYNGMKQWVAYLGTRTDERGIVVREEPDGWCLGDWCAPGKMELPESLVNTAYYFHSASLMSKVAAVLGKDEDRQSFDRLCEQIKKDFNTAFFNPATHHYWDGRQGADVFPLAFGMVEEDKKEAVFNALLTHLDSIGNHFDTGIMATPLLLKVLSDNGRSDIAFRLMDQRDIPGFGYVMDDRYSCLWERWEGKASRCHPMFGSVVAWFYNTLAGIRFDETIPGMKHIIIAPQPVGGLTYCRGTYQSLYGQVCSDWRVREGKFELTVEVPVNATATVILPDGKKYSGVGSGVHRFTALCHAAGNDGVREVAPDASLLTRKWDANWVSCPEVSLYDYGVYHFRKSFELNRKPDSFVINISADNRYRLFVNGTPVCYGPARGDLNHWYFETIDIAPLLKEGRNTLAAIVWNAGVYTPGAQMTLKTELIVQGNTAREAIVNTDPSWKVYQNPAYAPSVENRQDVGCADVVDASLYPWGWETADYDDSAWKEAVQLGRGQPYGVGTGYDWVLCRRDIPLMEDSLIRMQSVRRSEGLTASPEFLKGNAPLTVPANRKVTLLIDQSYLTNAYPELKVSGGKGSEIRMRYSEALYKDGQKGNRNDIEGREVGGFTDKFYPDGGSGRLFRPLWFRTYRYLQVEIETKGEPLTLLDLYGMYTAYPFRENGSFSSNLPELQKIWEVGWRTARLCANETYYDCPYYEQLQYVGDTRIQALISLYVDGDDRLMRKAIRMFDYSRSYEGITTSRYPSRVPQYIPPFSLYWINMVHDYWMYRDDPAFVKSCMPGVKSVLEWFAGKIDPATGILGPVPHWNFIDWPKQWPWNNDLPLGGTHKAAITGGSSILSLQLAYTLKDAIELLREFGEADLARSYEKVYDSLCRHTWDKCWNEEKQMLADDPDEASYSQHANIMGILSDAVPQEKQQALFNKLNTDPSLIQATFYYRFYLFRALKKVGLADQYTEMLKPW